MRSRPAAPRRAPRSPHHTATLLATRIAVFSSGSPSPGTSLGHAFVDIDAR
jgi:hypothetical protein